MEKVALVAFNGEAMCFVHVLLNALDMQEKGCAVKVIEGAVVKVVNELNNDGHPFHSQADHPSRFQALGSSNLSTSSLASLTPALKLRIPFPKALPT